MERTEPALPDPNLNWQPVDLVEPVPGLFIRLLMALGADNLPTYRIALCPLGAPESEWRWELPEGFKAEWRRLSTEEITPCQQ